MKDFYDEAEMASLTCGEEAKQEELAKSRKRQQAWVDREDCDSGAKANNWRAPKEGKVQLLQSHEVHGQASALAVVILSVG